MYLPKRKKNQTKKIKEEINSSLKLYNSDISISKVMTVTIQYDDERQNDVFIILSSYSLQTIKQIYK